MNRRLCTIALILTCALAAGVPLRGVRAQAVNEGGTVAEAPTAVSFDSDRWEIKGDNVRREDHLGRKSLFLSGGTFAHLKNLDFEDGTIEVDIAASTPRAFFGVVFRFRSLDEHEVFYLRAHKSGLPDAAQYTPSFNGSHAWQLYSGEGFTAAAEIPRDRWLHVKIEVAGLTGRIYLDNSDKPVMVISDLKQGYSKGSLGIYASGMGAHFSDFKFTPVKPSANRSPSKAPAQAQGILSRWELSEAFDTGDKTLESLPSSNEMKAMRWQAVTTESPGMVVIDRYRRSLDTLPPFANDPSLRLQRARGPKAVYARTTIYSDRDQVKKLSFGYSDEATLFLNGAALFTGKSAYRFRDPGFLGIMDVENDAVYLPLKKGANDLVLAVSEYFGGWGFICRLQDTAGVKIDQP
ncbi:MAG TPA: hypothetical protein VNH22_14340 [Blastocatellia bacterium]|jgi:hypothetical protein|nr:hypothetical protein [Blastocatellia bacterium]